ncbi:hypothetical protein HaLaN_31308 [Haematococcus lacustris]|uniref:Uncharacterized protein n=1 Tax=Haematococcus lacustris TaxID=44745 RepID=A0A6A0AGQ5_HAELA|nr:hypothetical protein HaLaN_31308 [Haematococcus lacustris]
MAGAGTASLQDEVKKLDDLLMAEAAQQTKSDAQLANLRALYKRRYKSLELRAAKGADELPFWYCQFLADAHIAKEPEDQWQFWLWSGGGAAYMVHSFRKAHALMKAKAPTTSPEVAVELRALWDLTDLQMKKADYYARRLRARGAAAALVAPAAYLAWARMRKRDKGSCS